MSDERRTIRGLTFRHRNLREYGAVLQCTRCEAWFRHPVDIDHADTHLCVPSYWFTASGLVDLNHKFDHDAPLHQAYERLSCVFAELAQRTKGKPSDGS